MGLVVKDDGWRIPDRVWARMEPLLPEPPSHPLGCHRPRVPDREAMNAILLVLRTGMQWNALNATGICSCSSAYRRFREWAEAGVFLEFWRQGLLAYDKKHGIDWEWLAMDGALGKAPLGGELTGPNPTDRAKKGAKRSLLTEGKGVPLGIAPAGANLNDFKLGRATIESIPIKRPKPTRKRPQGLCLDRGYDYNEVRELCEEFAFTAHIRGRGEEAQAIKREAGFRARRWVVERTHSWLNRFRRILTRWEKRADTYLAMLHLACGLITWRATDREPLSE
ncbi:MAG: IS5 family transposase [Pseudomonadota bacterium]